MTDIIQYVVKGGEAGDDPGGLLRELGPWSKEIDENLAREEHIQLTDEHWKVINYLRDLYREVGDAPNARALLHSMEERFAAEGGRKWLYRIFPYGPVTQGCKISALPVPSRNIDPSFGTVL